MVCTSATTSALGIDGDGNKHPLGVVEGATENAVTGRALIDNLIERGLDLEVCRLSSGQREGVEQGDPFDLGRHTPIQRCQIHKATTSSSAYPSRCMRRCTRRRGKRGSSTTLTRPSVAQSGSRESPGVAGSILKGSMKF
jgi:hypothetical protein